MWSPLLPIAALLLLYVPGLAWLRDRSSEQITDHSRLFREILFSAGMTSWLGLTLAEFGAYSLGSIVAADAAVAAIGYAVRGPIRWKGYTRHDAAGLLLVIAIALWVSPPLDTRLLAGDSPGYIASGIHLSRVGSLVMQDPTIAELDVDLRRAFFPSVAADRGSPPYLRLQGSLVLRSLDDGQVLPAFHHLLGVWLAISADLLGEGHMEWILPLFAGLAAWAIWLTACSLGGPWAGLLSTPVLAFMVPQYWYSRFLMPEIPSQYFLWGGLATFFVVSHRVRWLTQDAVTTGLAFGVAGLMRLENAAFIGIAMVAGVALTRSADRSLRVVMGVAGLVWAHLALHTACFRTHYWGNLQSSLPAMVANHTAAVVALVAALVAGVLLTPLASTEARKNRLGYCLVAAVIAIGIVGDWLNGGASVKLMLGYCGTPAVVLGGIGLTLATPAIWRRSTAGQMLVAVLALVYLQYCLAPHATPVPIWAMRRAVTVIVPSLAIGVGLLAIRVGSSKARTLLALGLLILSVGGASPLLIALRGSPLYAGSGYHLQVLSSLTPPDSVLLINPNLAGYGFASLLWVDGNRPVYYIPENDREDLRQLVDQLRNRPLYWITAGSEPLPVIANTDLVPVALYQFVEVTPQLEVAAPVDAVVATEASIAIYRLDKAAEKTMPPAE